jgi:catechol 2,3-dioxygenase-like lactoylglutathione lyase family enzyme
MFRTVDHIEMIVRDLRESRAFYEAIGFGLKRTTDHHKASVELQLGEPDGLVLEMHEPEMEENIGINHVAYLVDDMEAAVAALLDAGARLERGPVIARHTGRRLANFRDLDGWRLQIVSRSDDEPPDTAGGESRGPALRLDHIDLYTRGLDATAGFYRKIGLEVRRELEHAGAHTVELELRDRPPLTLEIKQVGDLRVIGINHLGFSVADVSSAHKLLSGRGYRFDYGPKFNEATGRTLCTARDPDGWRIQLTEVA